MSSFLVEPGGTCRGSVAVPGDKSISHRAVILSSLAKGATEISGLLWGQDVRHTMEAFQALGVAMEEQPAGGLRIHGAGLQGLGKTEKLYLGNSGTSMRLLMGILVAQRYDVVLDGDESLRRRPMGRVLEPLRRMGASLEAREDNFAPLVIHGGRPLRGISYTLPVASAQLKSALLLAGMYAQGTTRIREAAATRDHTERMLELLGYPLERDGLRLSLVGGGELRAPRRLEVPGDLSSAAFLLAGAAMAPGAELTVTGVGVNPTRLGLVRILQRMGAELKLVRPRWAGKEPVADIHIRHAPLHGVEIDAREVPATIDEFPALMMVAATAAGATRVREAGELRVKESDRIAAMEEGLRALGVEVHSSATGMEVRGSPIEGAEVRSHGDHRIAMALSLAALAARRPVVVRDCANVATSFPAFVATARQTGMRIREVDV